MIGQKYFEWNGFSAWTIGSVFFNFSTWNMNIFNIEIGYEKSWSSSSKVLRHQIHQQSYSSYHGSTFVTENFIKSFKRKFQDSHLSQKDKIQSYVKVDWIIFSSDKIHRHLIKDSLNFHSNLLFNILVFSLYYLLLIESNVMCLTESTWYHLELKIE